MPNNTVYSAYKDPPDGPEASKSPLFRGNLGVVSSDLIGSQDTNINTAPAAPDYVTTAWFQRKNGLTYPILKYGFICQHGTFGFLSHLL